MSNKITYKKVCRFILNLQFIFRPMYWQMNKKFSKEWDIILNSLLDKYKFTNIDTHYAQLGPTIIWISNVPYSCMHTYCLFLSTYDKEYYPKFSNVRPSRLTIIRCLKRLKLDSRSLDEIRDEKLRKLLK